MKGGTADAGGTELVRDLALCGAGLARSPPCAIRGLTSKGRGTAEPKRLDGFARPGARAEKRERNQPHPTSLALVCGMSTRGA